MNPAASLWVLRATWRDLSREITPTPFVRISTLKIEHYQSCISVDAYTHRHGHLVALVPSFPLMGGHPLKYYPLGISPPFMHGFPKL